MHWRKNTNLKPVLSQRDILEEESSQYIKAAAPPVFGQTIYNASPRHSSNSLGGLRRFPLVYSSSRCIFTQLPRAPDSQLQCRGATKIKIELLLFGRREGWKLESCIFSNSIVDTAAFVQA